LEIIVLNLKLDNFLLRFSYGAPSPPPSPRWGCVVIGETVENVMPNLFRHLIESNSYETLKQVQGDKLVITTQSRWGEGKGEG